MKKSFFTTLICMAIACFFIFGHGQAVPVSNEDGNQHIYFVDRQLYSLVPTTTTAERTPEKSAKKIAREILEGRDKNPAILRIIPNVKDGITVKVSGDTAYVNILSELAEPVSKNAETEKLFVYQIVNSLTSIDGIKYVRFTIDGKTKKDFIGFLDMRGIFAANYDI